MKKILVLNSIKSLVTFNISYSLPHSQKVSELASGIIINSIFKIIEIPENALNIKVTIQTINYRGDKEIIRQESHDKAINICYEVYQNLTKVEVKTTACQKFMGACAIHGLNKSSNVIRCSLFYTTKKETKSYISKPINKGQNFGFLVPLDAEKIKIKIDEGKNVTKDLWFNIYTENFNNKSYPTQKCYEITKPLFRSIKCTPLDCSKI